MAKWELKEKSTGEMIVTIEGEDWKKCLNKAFNKIAKETQIPGFRKGQAPKAMLDKRISSSEKQMQAVNDNVNKWLREGLNELDLRPISQPQFDIRSIDNDKAELVYTFTVMPTADVDNYKGLPMEIEEVTVSDDDIQAEIDRLRNQYAEWETVEEAAEDGNTVNIDYEGFKDGAAFEGGSAQGHDLVLGSGSFIPGFEDQLIGVKAGDEKDIELSFPEDYHAKELAGAPVVFKVKVNAVKKKSVPEADDDFAADLSYKDVETLADLKEFIRNDITDKRTKSAESKAESDLFEKFTENVKVDLPDVLIEDEVQQEINQFVNHLQAYGMSLTSYLQMIGKDVNGMKEDYRENAVKTLTMRLGLAKVAELEGLVPSDEDIEAELQDLSAQYSMELDEIRKMIDPDMLKEDVRNQKAYAFIKDNAVRTEKKAEE